MKMLTSPTGVAIRNSVGSCNPIYFILILISQWSSCSTLLLLNLF